MSGKSNTPSNSGPPKSTSGGQSPKITSGGQSPKTSSAGQPPKTSSGGQSPKTSSAGQSPKTSSGGQSPKTSNSGQSSKPSPSEQSSKQRQEEKAKSKPLEEEPSNQDDDETDERQLTAPQLPDSDINLLEKKGITIGDPLGSGSFSIVCRAQMNGKSLAVKIIDLTQVSKDYKEKFLPRELYAMTKLSHPNIIAVHQIYNLKETRIYVFMDLADGGDILDLIKGGSLSEATAKPLYRGIADALRYIHEKGLAHRDIKCENILLNKERTVAKISDFGFSRTCFVNQTGERLLCATYCGSMAYAAPEILNVKPYNAMISDVWSMGVVLYVMVNCRLPFNNKNAKEMIKLQLQKKIEYKQKLSELCRDLIGHHLEPDIKQRYTMKQVLKHKWF